MRASDGAIQIHFKGAVMKKIMVIATLILLFATICEGATLTTEIDAVRTEIYQTDSANSTITDAQIKMAINQSQEQLCNLLTYGANYENCITASCSYITGAVTLTSPTAFKKIIEVWDSAGKPYIQIKPEETHRLYGTNTTKDPIFSIEGGVISFRPAATTSGTMYIKYLKGYPRLSSGSDIIAVQDRYLDLITWGAAFILLQNDNQPTAAMGKKQTVTDQLTIENNQMGNGNIVEKMTGGAK